MGQNPPHLILMTRMYRWLLGVFGLGRVYPNAPIDVAPEDNPINEPESDVIVRKQRPAGYQVPQLQPGDMALVVEVSDTTLRFDLRVKARLYARAGVADYWVLDVNGR